MSEEVERILRLSLVAAESKGSISYEEYDLALRYIEDTRGY